MSIRSKVTACFVGILFLLVGITVYNYVRFTAANSRFALVNEFFLPFSRVTVQLQASVFSVAEDLRRIAHQSSQSPTGGALSRTARDLYPYVVSKKFNLVESMLSRHENTELNGVVKDLGFMVGKVKEAFTRLMGARDQEEMESAYLDMKNELHGISKRLDEESQRITVSAQNEGADSLISSLGLSAVVVLFGLLTLFMSQKALQPLPSLIESVKKIADGDMHQSLKVNASDKDEVSILAREYNRMLEMMRERDVKIQSQQQELLQSERLAAVGQLSAEVVHEIRNPLNAISLNIDWLEEQLSQATDEVRKTLRSISREIIRLHEITESYLVRSRVPIDETIKTEVHDLLNEILDFSREEYRVRNIEVTTNLASKEIYVKTDRSRLRQAILNILKNAKEAMPMGGRLEVRTEVKDNVYRIHISDTGYGMNDSTLQRKFHPFYTTKPNGTGLGLTLTKTVVEEAFGSIHCESRVGEGTTFTLQFPV